MENKKSKLVLSVLGILSLVLITAGVTYAFFSYAKEGKTTNTITTGSLEFKYTEGSSQVNITDMMPMADNDGVAQTGTGKVFNFTVTSKTSSTANIPFIVTAKKVATANQLADSQVKIYLDHGTATGTNNTYTSTTSGEPAVTNYTVVTFDHLKTDHNLYGNTTVFDSSTHKLGDITATNGGDEVVLFEGTVPASQTSGVTYNMALKMWINNAGGAVDYSPYEFVLKSAVSSGSVALSSLTKGTNFIKSVPYYAKAETRPESPNTGYDAAAGTYRNDWERIKCVTGGNVYTESYTGEACTGIENEQYYELTGGSFSVKVNVYANGAPVSS